MKSQTVEIVIEDIRSPKGQIVLGIFTDDKSFRKNEPAIKKIIKKENISGSKMTVKINLDPGVYGFSLLDDENSDEEMNFSFIGIPKEGFAFSGYYLTSLSRPKFDVFKFELDENNTRKVICRMKYYL